LDDLLSLPWNIISRRVLVSDVQGSQGKRPYGANKQIYDESQANVTQGRAAQVLFALTRLSISFCRPEWSSLVFWGHKLAIIAKV
jgi:hypothetical protein